jgi:(4S)-4-hydroxy-5-phosphonooxypentane-2,3-dione isomerase
MYVLCVTIYVRPASVSDFMAATSSFAAQSRQEWGNLRYDLLQTEDDPTCFVIYEAYRSKEDFLLHREAVHSIEWKEKIESWMARPRQRIRCNSIIFGND